MMTKALGFMNMNVSKHNLWVRKINSVDVARLPGVAIAQGTDYGLNLQHQFCGRYFHTVMGKIFVWVVFRFFSKTSRLAC